MKITYWFGALLGLWLLSAVISVASPMETGARLNVVPFDGRGLFAWAKRGTLLSLHGGRGGAHWYLYCDDKERLSVVSDNLLESAAMINAQLDGPVEAIRFAREYFADVAVSFFGAPHSYIITENYIENRAKARDFALRVVAEGDIERTLRVLKKYRCSTEGTIEDGAWKLTIYVALVDGSVEQWRIDGVVFPFAISHLEKENREKVGTVVPMPEIPARPGEMAVPKFLEPNAPEGEKAEKEAEKGGRPHKSN